MNHSATANRARTGRDQRVPLFPMIARLLCLLVLLLAGTAGCAARRDFNEAVAQDTVQGYEQFLKKHPDTKGYSARARKRLEELSFEQASEEDTLDAYLDFLQQFPRGKFSLRAEKRAEEIRADELGMNLYRQVPQDYHQIVTSREMPYRILVKSAEPEGETSDHVERVWYEDLTRKDLFVPLDPRHSSAVLPDITLLVRESVFRLVRYPFKLIEGEARVHGNRVRQYRVVGDQPERFLLYEIFKDRQVYDSLLQVSAEEQRRDKERYERLLRHLPLPGSMAFEYEIRQDAYGWDQQLTLTYVAYLKELGLYKDFSAYPRGQPPDRAYERTLHFRVEPDTHCPSLRRQWDRPASVSPWASWNSKWILHDQNYFFKKMTLDLVCLASAGAKGEKGE